jgi:hypothetical protein
MAKKSLNSKKVAPAFSKKVTLRSMIKEAGIDPSALRGWIEGEPVTITAILNNTAVYYLNGKDGRKFVETLDKVVVEKSSVIYLPTREVFKPQAKKKTP